MKTTLIIVLFTLSIHICPAQKAEVLRSGEKKEFPTAIDFAFIEPKTDSTNYEFVATYQVVGKKKAGNITNLFFIIADQAKKDGANAFKLNSFYRNDSLEEAALILDTYYWTDSIRNINFDNHEHNCIYIFGAERTNDNSSITFKIDNEKKELKAGTYYKYIRTEGKKVKINKGGLTGMTVFYTLEGTKPDLFLTLTGLGLGGGPVPADMIGVAVNTGRIYPVDGNLGLLLRSLFTQAE